MRNVKKNLTV